MNFFVKIAYRWTDRKLSTVDPCLYCEKRLSRPKEQFFIKCSKEFRDTLYSETSCICYISLDLLRHKNMSSFSSIRTCKRKSYLNFHALTLLTTHSNISVTQILYYS